MYILRLLSYIVLASCLQNCATVQFYTKDDLTGNETGIKFYAPKPYLLVERNPAKGISIKTSIVYLPDLSNPQYAKIQPGIGSADLEMDLTNGVLNSYGIKSDTKIPETITSIAGLISATGIVGDGDDSEETAEEEPEVQQSANTSDMTAAKAIVDNIKTGISSDKSNDLLTENQKTVGEDIENTLQKVSQTLNRKNIVDIPNIGKHIDNIITKLKDLKIRSTTDAAKNFNAKIDSYMKELETAKTTLKLNKSITPTFELYEVVINGTTTELIRVFAQ